VVLAGTLKLRTRKGVKINVVCVLPHNLHASSIGTDCCDEGGQAGVFLGKRKDLVPSTCRGFLKTTEIPQGSGGEGKQQLSVFWVAMLLGVGTGLSSSNQ